VTPPVVRLEDVVLRHDGQVAVSHLSGNFAPGSMTAIAGPNGAGKTTLLRAIAGLHPVFSGRIDRGGAKACDIALLPQSSDLDRAFPLSCRDMVMLGHWGRIGAFGTVSAAMFRATDAALEAVGIAGLAGRTVGTLSAGQFQRALFARLLVQDAPILLLDEPFNAVDERTAEDLFDIVRKWHEDGRTVIAVLHDIDLILQYFPDTLLLARETIAWGPSAVALSPANRARARLADQSRVGTLSAA
jgi:zinc/manganese transport system ATP-binding protein